jgi:hypothetical protein
MLIAVAMLRPAFDAGALTEPHRASSLCECADDDLYLFVGADLTELAELIRTAALQQQAFLRSTGAL